LYRALLITMSQMVLLVTSYHFGFKYF